MPDNTSGFFDAASQSRLVAIYTSHGEVEQQSIAYSQDRGRTWTKYINNPIIINPNVLDFRDPKVFWYAPEHKWVMVLAGGLVRFYSSPDLKQWTQTGELSDHTECPDLFALPVDGNSNNLKWVLSLGGRSYYLGQFNGNTFKKDFNTPLPVDYGPDFYAAQSWNNVPSSIKGGLWIGWMSNLAYASVIPTAKWRGMQSSLRTLQLKTFKEGVRLTQQPIEEYNTLRHDVKDFEPQIIKPNTNLLANLHGSNLMIKAAFVLDSTSEFGFKLRQGSNQETVVGYDVQEANLFVDRTHSGQSQFSTVFAARHVAPLLVAR